MAVDDVEELGAEELVDNPLSVALLDEPFPSPAPQAAASNGPIAALETRLKHTEGSLKDIVRQLNKRTQRRPNKNSGRSRA